MYFGYVKEKYIELLYEKKKKMTPENLGRHRFAPWILFDGFEEKFLYPLKCREVPSGS